eukprot:TRINITY_DN62078_c0_g1_i1.p1 TRINITY_DN62078_c0_g1~~TRINITY_DN62078_c0_g1_i1.p1  ORF type:complete len:638 (+),score=120.93 TRINITY_DN62078_c0_g1_i1:84-1997(+)
MDLERPVTAPVRSNVVKHSLKKPSRSYKAVLVPTSKTEENFPTTGLSRAFRKILTQLATLHVEELAGVRKQVVEQVDGSAGQVPKDAINEIDLLKRELHKLASLRSELMNSVSPQGARLPGQLRDSADGFGDRLAISPEEPPPALPLTTQEQDLKVVADFEQNEQEQEGQQEEQTQAKRKQGMLEKMQQATQSSNDVSLGEVPEKTSAWRPWLKRIAEGQKFEATIAALIMINVLFMMLQLQYDGYDVGFKLKYPWYERPAAATWPGADDFLNSMELIFTILFTTDVCFRILVCGLDFWRSALNIVDVFVVLVGLIVLYLQSPTNPSFIRMLRLIKVGRGLRALRNSPAVHSLQLLLKCLQASIITLFWSLCVLVGIQCIAAMILSESLKDFFADESVDEETRKSIFRYYGTFSKTMMTMFEILFANWIPAARILIENVSEWFSLVFILYRCLIGFATLNVVSAVFVQSTMKVAQHDDELLIAQKMTANEVDQKNLKVLFKQIDTSGDGELSYEELMGVMQDPSMKLHMSALDIDSHDLESLFRLLQTDDDDSISTDEFLKGIGRLKGPAKAIDMASTLVSVNRLIDRVDSLQTLLAPSPRKVDSLHFPMSPSPSEKEISSANRPGGRKSILGSLPD